MDFQRGFFQTADLCLRDVDFLGDFHLCFSFKETQTQDIVFAFI